MSEEIRSIIEQKAVLVDTDDCDRLIGDIQPGERVVRVSDLDKIIEALEISLKALVEYSVKLTAAKYGKPKVTVIDALMTPSQSHEVSMQTKHSSFQLYPEINSENS